MRLSLACLAGAALLAACTESDPGPVVAPPQPDADACGASGLQGLVGQPASVLAAMTFAQPIRVLRPGMAVTMDYSAQRLNIELDDRDVITRVACG